MAYRNPEDFLAWKKAYYRKNRDRILRQNKENYLKRREHFLAYRQKYYRDNIASHRVRMRNNHLIRKFGITSQEYDSLLKIQDGKCAICRCEPSKRGLVVDHCHKTKRVRGLLCVPCNSAIGFMRDDMAIWLAIQEYLWPTATLEAVA